MTERAKLTVRGGKYQTPGVYYEETVQRLASSPERSGVPLFVGLFELGESQPSVPDKGIYLQRWEQFDGAAFDSAVNAQETQRSFLSACVRGFFENGGQECFVFPIFAKGNGVAAAQALIGAFDEDGVLEQLEECDLVCVPDAMLLQESDGTLSTRLIVDVQSAALAYCKRMGERFAILDVPENDWQGDVRQVRQRAIEHWQALPSGNGALYFPWIKTRDITGPIPACGHVAGVFARSDARVGVHKAPANEIVVGATTPAINIDDAEQAPLSDAGVNCIREIPGRGIRVWGARTLRGQSQWASINTVRLVLSVNRWAERNLRDFLFETNGPELWDSVRRRFSSHCKELLEQGALMGRDPSNAFFVKCDAENNMQTQRDAGQLVVDIGLAPVRPAEFVVVRITRGLAGNEANIFN